MKKFVCAIAILGTALVSGVGAANADDFRLSIGPGGVYAGPARHHHWRDEDSYAYSRACRVIVHRHTNRWGEVVIRRERICD